MEAMQFSEIRINLFQTARRHIADDVIVIVRTLRTQTQHGNSPTVRMCTQTMAKV
jgi:hypothetical protein